MSQNPILGIQIAHSDTISSQTRRMAFKQCVLQFIFLPRPEMTN